MKDIAKESPAPTPPPPIASPTFRDLATQMVEPIGWLRTEIDRLFDDFGRPARSALQSGLRNLAPMPALEMVEDETHYRLNAELPGLDQGDVDVTVTDGILSITGEKKEETERKEKGFMLSERRYGAFERHIALPGDADPDAIKARVKHGVLSITIAKDVKAPNRKRRIEIEKA